MRTEGRPHTNDMFTALAHPVRRQILRRLIKAKGELSPRQLASELGEPLSALSYHVRVLAECEAVRLRRTKQVRGSTQHFYKPDIKQKWVRIALRGPDPALKRKRRRGGENG